MLGITTATALSPMGVVGMGMGFAAATATAKLQSRLRVSGEEAFPSFLPREVHKIKDPFARNLATRIHRLPLQVYLLKSIPLRLYATYLAFNGLPFGTCLDWTNVGRLHCLLPWWEDATVAFMNSGGYNVNSQIEQVKQKTLIIWGEDDQIISNKLAVKLHCELPNAIIRQVPDRGHIPHVEKPSVVAKLIAEFSSQDDC